MTEKNHKKVLAVIDFQNDFIVPEGKLTLNDMALASRMRFFASCVTDKMFDEVICTYDTHFPESFSLTYEGETFPLHCVYGTKGWEATADFSKLNPINITKFTTDMWRDIDAYPCLNKDFSNTTVYMTGVCTDICVEKAVGGFLARGAKVIVFEDLVKGINYQLDGLFKKYPEQVKSGQLSAMDSQCFFREYSAEMQGYNFSKVKEF